MLTYKKKNEIIPKRTHTDRKIEREREKKLSIDSKKDLKKKTNEQHDYFHHLIESVPQFLINSN